MRVDRAYLSRYATSQEMSAFSITLLELSDEIKDCLGMYHFLVLNLIHVIAWIKFQNAEILLPILYVIFSSGPHFDVVAQGSDYYRPTYHCACVDDTRAEARLS